MIRFLLIVTLLLLSIVLLVFRPFWQEKHTKKARAKHAILLIIGVALPCIGLYILIGAWPMLMLIP